MSNFELAKKANVSLSHKYDDKGHVLAHIEINNMYEHTFDSASRISKALNSSSGSDLELTTTQLGSRLNGGSYFMVDDQLVDFRDSHYDGFVQDDNAIEQLMKYIGYKPVESRTRAGLRLNTVSSDIMLMNRYDSAEFQVPGYVHGGKFQSNMLFNWSPFNTHVRGAFEIIREICTNGMIGSTELISHKIPMINRWEEHLEIASKQMQHSVKSLVSSRFSEMGHTRASVSDLQLIGDHVKNRKETTTNVNDRNRLDRLASVADPIAHCADFYNKNVFLDKNIAARAPGHLTQFDLFNIVTEVLSHTTGNEESSAGALQKFANKLLFPARDDQKIVPIRQPIASPFSDPDVAFFGA